MAPVLVPLVCLGRAVAWSPKPRTGLKPVPGMDTPRPAAGMEGGVRGARGGASASSHSVVRVSGLPFPDLLASCRPVLPFLRWMCVWWGEGVTKQN